MAAYDTRVPLHGSRRSSPPGARVIGEVDREQSASVTVYVRKHPDAPPVPSIEDLALIPPTQRPVIGPEEVESQLGASQQDLDAVADFARAQGLEVAESSAVKRSVRLIGPVGALSNAFSVKLARWQHVTGDYRGRTGPVCIPRELVGIVRAVFGLDNRRIGHSYLKSARNPAFFRSAATARGFLPPQLARLYNFPPQFDGTGQCIAILAFNGQLADTGVSVPGGYDPAGLRHYFENVLGIATPQIEDVVVHGPGNRPGDGTDPNDATPEILLDIQTAGGVAPGAKIVVYFTEFTEQGWVDALTAIATDTERRPSIISISYGNAETMKNAGTADQRGSLWTLSAINQANIAFQTAAHQNITIFCAAGDDGSEDEVRDDRAHVDFPASSPWVTACGGTRLSVAAGQLKRETVWNDGPGDATGGGISDLFPVPSWQQNVGVPPSVNPGHRIGRGVPDVASDADPLTGILIGDLQGQVNLQQPTGGTSAAAPLWAGLAARINQGLGARLGFMNPLLYTRFSTGVLHDVTAGSIAGYPARPGWDPCTGLGTPDGARLLQAFGSGSPTHAVATAESELQAVMVRLTNLERAMALLHGGGSPAVQALSLVGATVSPANGEDRY